MVDEAEFRRKRILGMALYLMISEKFPDIALDKMERLCTLIGQSGYEPSAKLLKRAEEALKKMDDES